MVAIGHQPVAQRAQLGQRGRRRVAVRPREHVDRSTDQLAQPIVGQAHLPALLGVVATVQTGVVPRMVAHLVARLQPGGHVGLAPLLTDDRRTHSSLRLGHLAHPAAALRIGAALQRQPGADQLAGRDRRLHHLPPRRLGGTDPRATQECGGHHAPLTQQRQPVAHHTGIAVVECEPQRTLGQRRPAGQRAGQLPTGDGAEARRAEVVELGGERDRVLDAVVGDCAHTTACQPARHAAHRATAQQRHHRAHRCPLRSLAITSA